MTTNFVFPVYAFTGVNFTQPLANGAATPMNNLIGLPACASGRFFIRAITVEATENFGPEFNFFGSAAGATGVIGTDQFISRYSFADTTGEQLNGAGPWRYYKDGLAIPYVDIDKMNSIGPRSLHVILSNVSATAKGNGTPFAVTFWVEPAQAW